MPHRTAIVVVSLVFILFLASFACGPTPPALPLLDAIDQDNADVVRTHMEIGTDPDKSFVPPGIPFAGASALHVAVLKDNREIVQLLLDNGADIDIRALDDSKGSPLEWAAYFGIKDMAVFLVDSGADINASNAYGTTPLDAASSHNPFIPEEERRQFDENRAFLRQYFSEKGAESTAPVLTLLYAIRSAQRRRRTGSHGVRHRTLTRLLSRRDFPSSALPPCIWQSSRTTVRSSRSSSITVQTSI